MVTVAMQNNNKPTKSVSDRGRKFIMRKIIVAQNYLPQETSSEFCERVFNPLRIPFVRTLLFGRLARYAGLAFERWKAAPAKNANFPFTFKTFLLYSHRKGSTFFLLVGKGRLQWAKNPTSGKAHWR